jgi:hypothetical protein
MRMNRMGNDCKWQVLLSSQIGILFTEELEDFIDSDKKDSEAFIKKQGEKLELYVVHSAEGKITKREFKGYVIDIKDLTRLRARKMSVRAKTMVLRLVKNIQRLILDRLLKSL